jgi:hypothetical protein
MSGSGGGAGTNAAGASGGKGGTTAGAGRGGTGGASGATTSGGSAGRSAGAGGSPQGGSGGSGNAAGDSGGADAGGGGSPGTDSCLEYCDAAQQQGCATTPLADCQNYCRQSFGPQCPEAKEVLYRCLLDNDSVCSDKHACDGEYASFMAKGCQGSTS